MKKQRSKRPARLVVREIMEPYTGGPGSTKLSLFVDLLVLFLILLSCALIPLELTYTEYHDLFVIVDLCITIVFIAEYALRWYSAENCITYPFSGYAVIDLVAILPSLIIFASHFRLLRLVRGVRILRILRLLRVIRILKFLRFGYLIKSAFIQARINFSSFSYRYQLNHLAKLFAITCIIWVIGANALFYTETVLVEHGYTSYLEGYSAKDRNFYTDYWHSYWNIIILLISGIEDKEPHTLLGRVEAAMVLIAGIVVIGLLTGEIVSIFVRRLQRMGLVKEMPPQKGLFEQHIVILGINDRLDNIIHHINDALRGHHFVLIVHPKAESLRIMDPRQYRRVFALAGDPSDKRVLDRACLEKAARIIILASKSKKDQALVDNQTLMVTIAAAVRPRDRRIPTAVEIVDEGNLHYDQILEDVEYINGKDCCERLTSQAVLNPGVTDIYARLLNYSLDTNEIYKTHVPKQLIGKPFKQAQIYFLDNDEEEIIPIGIERVVKQNGDSKPAFLPGIPADGREQVVFEPDDQLVVIAYDRPSYELIDEKGRWSPTYLARA